MRPDPFIDELIETVDVDVDRGTLVIDGDDSEHGSTYELATALGAALYDRHHARRTPTSDALDGFAHIRDAAFEQSLAAVVDDLRTSYDVNEAGAGVVLLEGVRVRLPDGLTPVRRSADRLTLETVSSRPALTPGFFLVRSSPWNDPFRGTVLRLYVRIDRPEHAVGVWTAAIDVLRRLRSPWQAKVLSHPVHFPRADALVVYLPQVSWPIVERLVDALSAVADGAGDVSRFARPLAPGVTSAFEPDDRRATYADLSFGQHRGRVLAQGLVAAARDGRDPAAVIELALMDAGIDPTDLARNLSSPATVLLEPVR